MNKKQKIATGIVVIVLASVFGIFFIVNKPNTKKHSVSDTQATSTQEDMQTSSNNVDSNGEDIISEDGNGNVSYSFENKDMLSAQKYMNTYNHIAIELIKNNYKVDDNAQNSNSTRYLSEMYLNKNMVDTRDFSNYKEEQLWDDMPKIEFANIFNFSCTDYKNPFDIIMETVKNQGIDLNIDSTDLDENANKEYGEKWYVINDANIDLTKAMEGTKYDKIESSVCAYVYKEDNTGNLYLTEAAATIKYNLNGESYIKDITCNFILFIDDENTSGGCSCGDDTDCSSGKECKTDCEM